jgi:hypothetical protein
MLDTPSVKRRLAREKPGAGKLVAGIVNLRW